MIIVDFKDENYKRVTGLWQWDYGQVLRIQGLNLPKAVEIHFSLQESGGEAKKRVGFTKDGVTDVVIPESMLENEESLGDYDIFAFIYLTDDTSGQTEYKICMPVKARPKPEAFDKPEDGEIFREAITAVRESADRAESAEQKVAEHAEQTKADAIKTGEDRTAIAEMVESVSGISEQVQIVKDYKEQAQTAATNALLSEQKSEQAKEAALQAQANAESAADEAEQHALEVAGDKAEVERLATQVRQDKTSVEQTAQGFGNTAQQAIQSVQSAGTQAVGEVNATKTDAVKAVQTEGKKQIAEVQKVAQEIVADREQIQTNKADIAELRQTKADAIVESANGTLINIKDSSGAFFEDFSVFGKTEQVNTTGANLFDDKQLLNENNPNYDKTLANTGIWWFKIPTEGVVTVSLKNGKQKANYYLVVSDKKGWNTGGTEHWLVHPAVQLEDSATITPIDGCIWLGVNTSISAIKSMLDIVGGIMINNGGEAKPYEPYTGGKPSPSQAYPQGIVSAGKYDETSGKYVIDVSVTGKNLVPPELDFVPFGNNDPKTIEFDPKTNSYKLITKPDNFNQVTCYVKFNLKKGIYTITRKIKIDGVDITNPAGLQIIDADTKENLFYQHIGINRKFELKKDTNVLINLGCFTEKTQKEAIIYEVQLEKSDVPTPYEPYHEPQTLTIPLDRPLTKWDRIEKRDGVYGIVYTSKHVIFDGGAEGEWIRGSTGKSFYLKGFTGLEKSYEIFCDKLKNYKGSPNEMTQNSILGNTTDLRVSIDGITDVETLRTWLSKNNLDVYYLSKESEFVPLPEETQTALNALHTNYPTTIISNSEDCEMEVEYVADTKNYINKQIQEIVTKQIETDRLILERTM